MRRSSARPDVGPGPARRPPDALRVVARRRCRASRVHTGPESAQAAASVAPTRTRSATTSTSPRDLRLGRVRRAPLAHEVAHTVQQRARRRPGSPQLEVSAPQDAAESTRPTSPRRHAGGDADRDRPSGGGVARKDIRAPPRQRPTHRQARREADAKPTPRRPAAPAGSAATAAPATGAGHASRPRSRRGSAPRPPRRPDRAGHRHRLVGRRHAAAAGRRRPAPAGAVTTRTASRRQRRAVGRRLGRGQHAGLGVGSDHAGAERADRRAGVADTAPARRRPRAGRPGHPAQDQPRAAPPRRGRRHQGLDLLAVTAPPSRRWRCRWNLPGMLASDLEQWRRPAPTSGDGDQPQRRESPPGSPPTAPPAPRSRARPRAACRSFTDAMSAARKSFSDGTAAGTECVGIATRSSASS